MPRISKILSPRLFWSFFSIKADGRKKHFKLLKKHACGLAAAPLREWEAGPWIDFLAVREGLRFSPSAKALFSQLAGTGLLELSGEMKKLKTYMGGRTEVLSEDLTAIVSRARLDSVFDLTEAIGKKDLPEALACLARLLTGNQSEAGALALVARHIRILSRLQEGERRRLTKTQLAAMIGTHPIFLKSYQKQAHLWTGRQIKKTMEALYETDKALKSSPLSAHIWLENLYTHGLRPLKARLLEGRKKGGPALPALFLRGAVKKALYWLNRRGELQAGAAQLASRRERANKQGVSLPS